MIRIEDLLRAVQQRWRLAMMLGITVFAVVIVAALLQPRRYLATASLLIDVTQADPTDTSTSPSPQLVDSIIGTQADVVRSTSVLQETLGSAGLVRLDSSESDKAKALDSLSRRLVVGVDRGSNVIRVTFLDRNANRAARVVNTVADVFLRKQVELRAQPARTNERWFNSRVAEARGKLEAAQTRLSNFQRQHNIVGINRMDLEADKVRSLSAALVEAQANAADARSRAGGGVVPEVESAAAVQDLEREASLQAAKVADLANTLGANHPQMIAERAHLAELRASLASVRGTKVASLTAGSSASGRREADLRRAVAEQQARMLSLSTVQDQLNVLERDVDAARQSYDSVRKNLNDATLKSEIPQASASRLDRASRPVLPAEPNLLLWFVAALMLGSLAAVLPIVVIEIINPRVRTARGTANSTQTNVILDLSQAGRVVRTDRSAEGLSA